MLLNVEGKVFFSILARRMTEFLRNKYIDTSAHKGGIPGVLGCFEHTGAVIQLIREAREGNGDLAVFWLDLHNTYESIPQKLVETTWNNNTYPARPRTSS